MVIGMSSIFCYRDGKKTTRVETKSWKVLSNKTSSMHAELYAIVCALESLPRPFRYTCKLTVLTDCLEAVRAIKGHLICSRYRGMVKHIRSLLKDFPYAKVIWCKSHSGYKWNELANELAKKEAGTWKGKGSNICLEEMI